MKRLAGIALEDGAIEGHLGALGFDVVPAGDGVLQVTPPSWRHDVSMEADIVEELVRLHGYDRVPPMPVRRTEAVGHPALSPGQRARSFVKRTLVARGLAEAVTWSFAEPALAARFGGGDVRVRNPINAELSVLRPSPLPNLLSAAARNQNRGNEPIALFELGPAFSGGLPGQQAWVAGGVRLGQTHDRHWAEPPRSVDLFDARADALAVLVAGRFNTEALRVVAEGPDHYHPGRRGRLMLGPKAVLAEFGEVHPEILGQLDIEGVAVAFEVFLDQLPKPRAKVGRGRPPLKASPFPPVERDFAFVLDDDVPAEALLGAVRNAEKNLIREVSLFDVYRGTGIGDGRKSLAIAVRLQAQDRTLAEADIEAVVKKIVGAASKATGAVLRA